MSSAENPQHTPNMCTVLLYNNLPVICGGMARLLRDLAPHFTVKEAVEEAVALQILNEESVQLIIASESMLHSLKASFKNKGTFPSVMLFYSDSDTAIEIKRKNEEVLGLMHQSGSVEELINGINSVLEGRIFLCNQTLNFIMDELICVENKKPVATSAVLSKRESEIKSMMKEGKRITVIANELRLKPSTVSTIKKNIFKKLGFETMADLYGSMD